MGDKKFALSPGDSSNAQIAVKALLEHAPVPKQQIHFIRTDIAPEDSAREYENLLHQYFSNSEVTFDLVILGMGKNGNTLSLLPGNDENNERYAWVMPVHSKEEDLYMITLTSAVINASAIKAFLITGKDKQDVVQHALLGKYDPEKYPAQLIQTVNKTVHWFLDENAAAKLIKISS